MREKDNFIVLWFILLDSSQMHHVVRKKTGILMSKHEALQFGCKWPQSIFFAFASFWEIFGSNFCGRREKFANMMIYILKDFFMACTNIIIKSSKSLTVQNYTPLKFVNEWLNLKSLEFLRALCFFTFRCGKQTKYNNFYKIVNLAKF